jgi:predicted glycogen debranching enzyme
MINFNAGICADLGAAMKKEWLETNGVGGFASSTITGMNTRRYHALLVAAQTSSAARVVLLSKLEETLVSDGERFSLSTNQYPQVIHPQGCLYLQNFRLEPFPVFTFRAGAVEIEKIVFMVDGLNTTVVRYKASGKLPPNAKLEVRPLVAFRDYHSLQHETNSVHFSLEHDRNLTRIERRDDGQSQTLHLAHDDAAADANGVWYRHFEYAEEMARGFDFREDLYNPCTLVFELTDGATRSIIASTEKHDAREADAIELKERARRAGISNLVKTDDEYTRALCLASDQFLIHRGADHESVIAGYHWFTDWGRDTMISLTGLTLSTERYDSARKILQSFAEHLSDGMIPNRFPDASGEPEYNTVDATLWFIHAINEYLRRTKDTAFVRQNFYERLIEIIHWHERGTRYGIHVTEDGLLRAGEAGVQLTWMDAKVGDWVVTPRTGKAVEIQALWYNALRIVEEMAARFKDVETHAQCRELAFRAHESFNRLFWNEAAQSLYDVVRDDNTPDAAIRPNQIFAVSLPHSMLAQDRAQRIVKTVRRELLTPYGLRSLSPRDPAYRGRYEGDSLARDGAYHQGTVWAWLIGPFITAHLKTHGRTPEAQAQARAWTELFRKHLSEAGLNQVSEIFDGDAPHTPRGCIAQAWSVAELLRCKLEEFS